MAEKTFDLQTSEQIVRREAFVRCGSWSAFTGELVLANQALVYVNRGLFGNHEGYKRFELTEIAQAIFGEAQNGNDQLEVCYRGGRTTSTSSQEGSASPKPRRRKSTSRSRTAADTAILVQGQARVFPHDHNHDLHEAPREDVDAATEGHKVDVVGSGRSICRFHVVGTLGNGDGSPIHPNKCR